MNYDPNKIVLVGPEGVGKSTLIYRIRNNVFYKGSEPTIGASFIRYAVDRGDKTIYLDFWDVAGQERFTHMLPMFLRNAKVTLLCFEHKENMIDIVTIKKYVERVRKSTGARIYLVITKIDLCGTQSVGSLQQKYSHLLGYTLMSQIPMHFTSSITAQGISELLEEVSWEMSTQEPLSEPIDISLSSDVSPGCCSLI